MGKLRPRLGRPRDGEGGYILLDVIAGLCIIAIGFAVFLGSLSMAGNITSRQSAALDSLIQERSTHAQERNVFFSKK